uniref:Uncharacterized protein n=1 Tax=Chromera velia CCMP2878 TaxID=1169474 RepID=A0A0G4HFC9_9ALVE|eukprot:Cvel_26944.t1-p1 / transcript=Cvel_26944.t1 / gene=Cvel_26944 / organism=Chromera_velia_CCMP2878 / gene_product=MORN repeat-containing protein 3, putative / transcript_product=MORN repeat-containing protein 3, putative / location=Cvel_scaffold3282:9005-9859(+) / protein_length=285 / sequence_SO=supercontig / SO=protein_coding / is_pseudo=false
MVPPIFRCEEGHTCCKDCRDRLPDPPLCCVCSSHLSMRSRELEKLCEELQNLNCRYHSRGCGVVVEKYVDLKTHERECTYAPVHTEINVRENVARRSPCSLLALFLSIFVLIGFVCLMPVLAGRSDLLHTGTLFSLTSSGGSDSIVQRLFKGEWKNVLRNGHGKETSPNGDVFEGEWKFGRRHGKGKQTSPKGRIIEGEWRNGVRNGHVKETSPNGVVLSEGEWKDGKRYGKGKETYPNGDVFEGEWSNGVRNGHGKETSPIGLVFEGEWKDRKRNGHGKERGCV